MKFAIIACSTKLSILTPPQIFSGDIPFAEISCWSSLRSHVVKYAKRPPKPQLPDDIGREFDDKLWSLIEECWSQEPCNRPTAATVSLRLGGVDGCLVNPAEMYKKEIAAFTEELARVKERSKAAIQYLETELAELKKNLNEERDLRKRVEKNADELRDSLARRELEEAELKKDLIEERDLRKQAEKNADKRSDERIKTWRQDLETVQTELAKLRDSLARRELEQAELKKDLNGERDLRKQAEKNADERSKAARQDLERELANLRNSLARQELEQAELKKGVDEENQLPKQLETDADGSELPISILCTDGPGVSPSEPMAIVQKPIVQVESPSTPNGIYILRNREENVYWCMTPKTRSIFFLNTTEKNARNDKDVSILLQLFK